MKEAAIRVDATDPFGATPRSPGPACVARSRWVTLFDRLGSRMTRLVGSPTAFCVAVLSVLLWAMLGPALGFSDGWQLTVNTGTTIVTFLMVFLIQQAQNKDSVAMHLKLDELLAANRLASNRMIGIEDLDEQDLRDLAAFYVRLAERAKNCTQKESHSIDEEGMPADRVPSASPAR